MKFSTLVISLSLLAGAGLPIAACDLLKPKPQRVHAMAVIIDASGSTTWQGRCREARARLAELLTTPGLRRLDVTVWELGVESPEPAVLIPFVTFRRTTQAFEHDTNRRHVEEERWLDNVTAQCRARLRPSGSSIRIALTRAVESLRDHCRALAPRAVCVEQVLLVHSDGIEGIDAQIKVRLTAPKRSGKTSLPSVPTIDTSTLTQPVRWCGIANTKGEHPSAVDPDRVTTAWREVLGGRVLFDASCGEQLTDLATGRK